MRKILITLQLLLLVLISSQTTSVAGTVPTGRTKIEITQRVLAKIKVGMPMLEVERLLGAPGRFIEREDGIERYRWKGPTTAITVSFDKKSVVDAIAVTRKGKYLSMDAPKSGLSAEVFNEAFLEKLKTISTYEGVVALVGPPGMTVREDAGTTPTERYYWNGGMASSLTVTIAGGKVVDANVTSPKGDVHSLHKGGELTARK